MKNARTAGIALAFTLLLALIPAIAFAAEGDLIAEGNCGPEGADNLTYRLTETAIPGEYALTLSGTGEMERYYPILPAPWDAYRASITTVTLPSGLTTVGRRAFYGCASLTSVSIPSGVTAIGDEAFRYCSSLTAITLPEGITAIGNNVFNGCASLASVNIPANVTAIGYGAFDGCRSLESIRIPDGVTTIGNGAFNDCDTLVTVTIPPNVTALGRYAFRGCAALTEILFEGTTAPTLVFEGSGAFENAAPSGRIVIPANGIGYGAAAFLTYVPSGWLVTSDTLRPLLTVGTVRRTSGADATVTFTSSEAGTYYYAFVARGEAAPALDTITLGAGTPCGTTAQTLTLSGLSAGIQDLYLVAKDAGNNVSILKIEIPAYTAIGGGTSDPAQTETDAQARNPSADVPSTGDGSPMGLWAVLLCLSTLGFAGFTRRYTRRKSAEE